MAKRSEAKTKESIEVFSGGKTESFAESDFRRANHGTALHWLIVAAFAFLSASVSICWCLQTDIGFDETWHLFIAHQKSMPHFFSELKGTFHPPLYFLLLKLCHEMGFSLFAERMVSVLAGILVVIYIGKILRALGLSPVYQALGMFLCALSQGHVLMSIAVRSYMLSSAFQLISFYYLLLSFSAETSRESRRVRTIFYVFAFLSILTHYQSLIYVGAVVLVIAALSVVSWEKKKGGFFENKMGGVLEILGVSAGAGLLFAYSSMLRPISYYQFKNYLAEHSWGSGEGLADFLIRNGVNEFNLFTPVVVTSASVVCGIVVVLGVLLLWAGNRSIAGSLGAKKVKLIFVYFLAPTMLFAIIALSLVSHYPFGGELRHQFVIFPFLLLLGVAALHSILGKAVRPVIGAVIAAAVLSLGLVRVIQLPQSSLTLSYPDEWMPDPAGYGGDQKVVHLIWHDAVANYRRYVEWDFEFVGKVNERDDLYKLSNGKSAYHVIASQVGNSENLGTKSFLREVRGIFDTYGFRELFVLRPIGEFFEGGSRSVLSTEEQYRRLVELSSQETKLTVSYVKDPECCEVIRVSSINSRGNTDTVSRK